MSLRSVFIKCRACSPADTNRQSCGTFCQNCKRRCKSVTVSCFIYHGLLCVAEAFSSAKLLHNTSVCVIFLCICIKLIQCIFFLCICCKTCGYFLTGNYGIGFFHHIGIYRFGLSCILSIVSKLHGLITISGSYRIPSCFSCSICTKIIGCTVNLPQLADDFFAFYIVAPACTLFYPAIFDRCSGHCGCCLCCCRLHRSCSQCQADQHCNCKKQSADSSFFHLPLPPF